MSSSSSLHLIPHDLYCIRFTKLIEMVNALVDLIESNKHWLIHDLSPSSSSSTLLDMTQLPLSSLPITLNLAEEEEVTQQEQHFQPEKQIKRSNTSSTTVRASYLIEKDQHVFGGCMEEEAGDEFFISSGAVYQSWPYVYEPGYGQYNDDTMTNLVNIKRVSKSVDFLNMLSLVDGDESMHCSSSTKNSVSSIAAYSLKNFDVINLVTHNNNNNQSTRRRRKKHSLTSESVSDNDEDDYDEDEVYLNSYNELDDDQDGNHDDFDEDDNSESYLEYKKRHAMGLPSPASVYQCYSTGQQATQQGNNYKRISYSLDCNRLVVSNQDIDADFENTDEYESSSSEFLNNNNNTSTLQNTNSNIWPGVNSNNNNNNNNRLVFFSQKKVGRRYYHPNDYYLLMRFNKK